MNNIDLGEQKRQEVRRTEQGREICVEQPERQITAKEIQVVLSRAEVLQLWIKA